MVRLCEVVLLLFMPHRQLGNKGALTTTAAPLPCLENGTLTRIEPNIVRGCRVLTDQLTENRNKTTGASARRGLPLVVLLYVENVKQIRSTRTMTVRTDQNNTRRAHGASRSVIVHTRRGGAPLGVLLLVVFAAPAAGQRRLDETGQRGTLIRIDPTDCIRRLRAHGPAHGMSHQDYSCHCETWSASRSATIRGEP